MNNKGKVVKKTKWRVFVEKQEDFNDETKQLIEKLEKINIEHAINLALDMKDKNMFLKLSKGVY